MKRLIAVAAALAIAGCHRHAAADVTLDADADARNAAETKINADLAAADAAARASIPRAAAHPAPPSPAIEHTQPAAADAKDGADIESDNRT